MLESLEAMRQILNKLFFFGASLLFFFPSMAFAQLKVFSHGGEYAEEPTLIGGVGILTLKLLGYDTSLGKDGKIFSPIVDVIFLIFSFLGMIFFGLMVYGGIRYMFARGHEEDVEKATKIFRDGIIGLLIVLASYFITYFVIGFAFSLSVAPEVGGTIGGWLCDTIDNGVYQSIFCL